MNNLFMKRKFDQNINIACDNILSVSHLTVAYGKETQAVHDVSFDMKKGEILGIVGESGCGKSTLARTIAGLVKPSSGKIELKNSDSQNLKNPQMIFQNSYGSLNPAYKVRWILEEPLRVDRNRKWNRQERTDRIKEVMEQVELTPELLERYPAELSGGQRQRVGIAVAIMQSPRLLIADEPVSALDVTIQAQIVSLMKKLHEETGISILFISHDLRVVYNMCDRLIIMKEGNIVESGITSAIYNEPKADYTKRLLTSAGIMKTCDYSFTGECVEA